jgi:FOG: FHA domain
MIRIGKANDNDFVVNNPSVSRYHAQLHYDKSGSLMLEDLGSSNGTFVNDNQIAKKRILPTDVIRLGDNYILNQQVVLNANNDYSEEFEKLKKIYKVYIEAKVKIQSSNQLKTRLLQSLPFAIPGIIGVTIGFIGNGSEKLFAASLAITILLPTMGIYLGARQAAKIPVKLQTLADKFKIDYVCPKCRTYLGENPWEALRNKQNCPACKAKWVYNRK